MKIRNSFVSNSSSSSFVICLPEDITWEKLTKNATIDWFADAEEYEYEPYNLSEDDEDYEELLGEYFEEETRQLFLELKNIKTPDCLWQDNCNYAAFCQLVDLMQDYTLAEIDDGAESGRLIPIELTKIKDIIYGKDV